MAGPGKRGSNKFKPTEQEQRLVEAMAAYGIPRDDIARVVGISPKTLSKHFSDELDTAQIKSGAKVAEALFAKAMDGNVTAMIFWLKCQQGWREDGTSGIGMHPERLASEFHEAMLELEGATTTR